MPALPISSISKQDVIVGYETLQVIKSSIGLLASGPANSAIRDSFIFTHPLTLRLRSTA